MLFSILSTRSQIFPPNVFQGGLAEKEQKDSGRTVQRLFKAVGVMKSPSLSAEKASAQHGEARLLTTPTPPIINLTGINGDRVNGVLVNEQHIQAEPKYKVSD